MRTFSVLLAALVCAVALNAALGQGNVVINFEGEEYSLPQMHMSELRKIFNLNGGYLECADGFKIFNGQDIIRSGRLVVTASAVSQNTPDTQRDAFFDRVRFREATGETRYAQTMRDYWSLRREIAAEHIGRYVYFCAGAVQAVADTAETFLSAPKPACGSETAFVARVGSEIETTYTYQNFGKFKEYNTDEGPMVAGAFTSIIVQLIERTGDRRQQDIKRHMRLENVLIDTGAEEVNLAPGDIPLEGLHAMREVENRGLYGRGWGRMVPIRVKFADTSEALSAYQTLWVVLNDDKLNFRLLGMRFLQKYYVMLAGPTASWKADPEVLPVCAEFLNHDDVSRLANWQDEQFKTQDEAAKAQREELARAGKTEEDRSEL